MPKDDFEYPIQYKLVYENMDELFGRELEYWSNDYEDTLKKNGEILGNYLMEIISDEEKDVLSSEYEWDRDWQGLLDQRIESTEWGQNKGGPPVSSYFIDGWDTKEHQRLVFTLFIESIVVFFRSKGML